MAQNLTAILLSKPPKHIPAGQCPARRRRARRVAQLAALSALCLACYKDPEASTAGHGGAPAVGGADAGADAHGGAGGDQPSDAGPDCGSPPNGGIGTCKDPISDCPALTVDQAACWNWTCDCTPGLCYCVAVAKS